ncbi:TIR domain-containing protein [Carnobacterium maltaromaticum]|uniref:TIR domain-containing protein n=1 Tax=Carnobacterium maltaromaticum TaxID=2751 RepID=A0AAW9JVE1_CARML|nr:TIR domain-containing protein [Carnobacterium maltaromaticum]MDZ5758584.1 TIR domain-containing protein [Carnobacterium maltaromaticum]
MARRVFFSFHYENDVTRSMVVRNSLTIKSKEKTGFVDKAEFEKIKRQGDRAIKKWIDTQLNGTSVTVVLVGSETLNREYVKYEIEQSYKRGNAILAVNVGNVKDLTGNISTSQSVYNVVIGKNIDGSSLWFSNIVDGIYDYKLNDGYNNLGDWIEKAATKKGK